MTTLTFDPHTGRLRLRPEDLGTLVAAASGTAPPTPTVEALFVDGQPHESIAPALRAAAEPTCALIIRLAHPDGVALHKAWVDPDVAALLLDVDGTLAELVTVASDHVPAALARILGLGPRRATARVPQLLAPTALDRAFSADSEDRASIAEQLFGPAAERWRIVAIETAWPDGVEGTAGRALVLADSPDGLCRLVPNGATLETNAVSPTEVWRLLIGLLPADSELGRTA